MSSVASFASLRSILPILFLFAVIGFLPVNARAATFTVTTGAPVGPGSLRAAIALANGTPSDDVIVFSEFFSSPQTIFLSRTLPPIAGTLTIDGGNHKVIISGDNQHRILDINPGAVLTILNLTLTNGITYDTGGGAAIRNNGTLTINNSTLSNNSTGGATEGGAIANFGTATIVSSTISGNQASGFGGGIANSGMLTISSSTVTNNIANSDGGGIYNCMGCTLNAKNTIVAGNTNANSPDVSGALTSQGYNLVGNTSGMSITGDTTGNILNQSAELAALADNGGLTMTHRLMLTSPAIDTGNGAGLATDQRGLARRFDAPGFSNAAGGDTADIGAFEVQPRLVVSAPASTPPGTPINITVTATGLDGSVVTAYNGTVHFTSTDPNATLPADYTFIASDNGTRQFSVTLRTPGDHTITAADLTAAVTGTSRNTRVIGPLNRRL